MYLKRTTVLTFLILTTFIFASEAQKSSLRIEPPIWWTNMPGDTLQLMIYGKDISKSKLSIQYPGVTLLGTSALESPNYIFADLLISKGTTPGTLKLKFQTGSKTINQDYQLKARTNDKDRNKGFGTSDLIYLIMPDRFANGDPKNDNFPNMPDKMDRTGDYTRHGGDLKGISDHLDYVKELGATAIWINPVLENNMLKTSYHGYSITDFYKIDARFGSNEDFVKLVRKCHEMGIKVIMDMVLNHLGTEHWWMKDLPSKDWIHQFETYTSSNYHLATGSDPHASERDKTIMEQGWFDKTMADINQSNPYFARYLIQNAIWWMEYSGMDGIRMDTYPYSEKNYLAKWSTAVMKAYPNSNIVGEVWTPSVANASYWVKGSSEKYGYNSGLPSVTDFPLLDAMSDALNNKAGWNEGLGKLYHTLAEDFLYQDPNKNMVFLENHDLTRTFTVVKEDFNKYKIGLTMVMTMRGFPQIYYGSEILMTGDAVQHSNVRKDFPGGWPGDTRNAFTNEGRTEKENEAFNYVKTLATWRKNNPELMAGKMTQFIPENDTYVYFRHSDSKAAMIVINTATEPRKIDMKRFEERLKGFATGKNVMTGETLPDLKEITIEGVSSLVVELNP
jgi:neopullulanase